MAIDPDNWTPRHGWTIAMVKATIRSAIAVIPMAAVIRCCLPLEEFFSLDVSFLAIFFGATSLVGAPIGALVCRKLADSSGLSGRSLFLPVAGMLLAASLAAASIGCAMGGSLTMFYLSWLALSVWTVGTATIMLIWQ